MSNKPYFLFTFYFFFFLGAVPTFSQDTPANESFLSWTAVPGAREYQIEIQNESEQLLLERRLSETRLKLDLPPGIYRYRIRVIDRFNRTAVGEWRSLTVRRNAQVLLPARALRIEPESVVQGGVTRGVFLSLENALETDRIVFRGPKEIIPLSILRTSQRWELVLDLKEAPNGNYEVFLVRSDQFIATGINLRLLPLVTVAVNQEKPPEVPPDAVRLVQQRDRFSGLASLPIRKPELPLPLLLPIPPNPPEEVSVQIDTPPELPPENTAPVPLSQLSMTLGYSVLLPQGWFAEIVEPSLIGGQIFIRTDSGNLAVDGGSLMGMGLELQYHLFPGKGILTSGTSIHLAQGFLHLYLRTPWPEPVAFFLTGGIGVSMNFFSTESDFAFLSTDPAVLAGAILRYNAGNWCIEISGQYHWFFYINKPSSGMNFSVSTGFLLP